MASQKAMINTLMFYHWDNALFNNMSIPQTLNRDDVVSAILIETSDFPVIITDLETLRYAIEVWSKHRIDVWEKLLETTNYEYNPIENYDRTESTTDILTETGYGTVKGDGGLTTISHSNVKSGETTKTISGRYSDQNSGSDTSTESVSAFNDGGFSNHEQNVLQHGLKVERTYNNYAETESCGYPDDLLNPTEIETTKTTNLGGERTDKNFTDSRTITGRIHGNIGVTTTQQMIQAQRDIVRFDIIDEIVKDYKTEFCILVY